MQADLEFFEEIRQLLHYHNIVSISGESGTGKTTLALHLIGNLLTQKKPYIASCIWIQASERFPIKRLTQIFEDTSKRLEYIKNNTYLLPQKGLIHTYEEQISRIRKIIDLTSNNPPSLKYIVIDNISHHLRYKLTQFNNPKDILPILDDFYETQLMPLILFCKRNEISLILIHEVTYIPTLQKIRPFFYKLYDRIKTIDIVLSKFNNNKKMILDLFFNELKWTFQFSLEQKGIIMI